ncbi:hypothetical protein [Sulfuricurvum sp.]|uniref:hypothetical protein n=1 Tax=Sulfuricurvum sp. TaxID=2025608 RepID=UPI003BB64B54
MTQEEQAILFNFVDTMEKEGHTVELVRITFTDSERETINKQYNTKITNEKMEEILNRLLSHEYIKHTTFGGEQFSNLKLTLKGLGIVNSIRNKDEQKKQKSYLKKASDYVEEHKGLFLAFGFVVTLITLILNFKGK